VDRSCCIVGSPGDIYNEFTTLLQSSQDHIHNPYLLIFVSSAHLISAVDKCLVIVREKIRQIEGRSGHGGWHNQEPDIRRAFGQDILENDTMAYSKDAAECTTTLANLERQVELVIELNSLMIKNTAGLVGNDNDQSNKIKDSMELAIDGLQKRVKHAKPNVRYLQERARTQSTVVSSITL